MQYDRVMGPSVRAALVAGFAIVFAMWLLWGYQLVRSLHTIEQNVTSAHESYVRGEQTLSKIRTNVLLGSIYLRDAGASYAEVAAAIGVGETSISPMRARCLQKLAKILKS